MLSVNFQKSKSANEIWNTSTCRTNRVSPLNFRCCCLRFTLERGKFMLLVNFRQSKSANEIWKTSTCRTNRASLLNFRCYCLRHKYWENGFFQIYFGTRKDYALSKFFKWQVSKQDLTTSSSRTNRVSPLGVKVCASYDATETRISASFLFTSRIQEGALLAWSKYSEMKRKRTYTDP